jgi:hypothetical protein
MNKKWWILAGMGLVAGLLVLSLAIPALAQDTTPTPPTPKGFGGWEWGFGCGLGAGESWTTFDAIGQALGLTPVELFTELHSGKTLQEIATAKGVDLQKVQDAAKAAQVAAEKAAIEQAVQDGTLTQAQADWLLQGIEQGWMPMGRGGHGHGMGPMGLPGAGTGPSTTTPSVTPNPSAF